MRLKIDFHKISVFFLSIFIIILPIDVVIANPKSNLSYTNYIILMYALFRISEMIIKRKCNIKELLQNKFLFIFPVYMVFTIFFRQSEFYSNYWVTTFIASYFVFLFSITNNYNEQDEKKIKHSIVASAGAVFLATIFLGNTNMNGRLSLTFGSRVMDPNYFSVCLCLINSWCFFNILNKNKRLFYSIIMILIWIIIIMTGSRGGTIANAIAMIVLFVFSNIKTKNKIIFVAIFPIILLILSNFVFKYISQDTLNRYTLEYNEESQGAGRFEIWKNGLETFKDNNVFRMMFGTGFGTYKYVTKSNGHVAHNMFIQTLIEGGILGEVMLIGILSKVLIKSLRKKDYIILASLCGLLMGAMSLDFINSRMLWFCLFLGSSSINITNANNLNKIEKEKT